MTALDVRADPFPHLVVDGWWPPSLLADVLSEFPDPDDRRWRTFDNGEERKYEGGPQLWGPYVRELLDEIGTHAGELGEAFGIPDLRMETVGGGYHLIPPGGYLAVHTDFNRSPVTGLHRRLNLLVYLNDDWQDEQGGQLELWGEAGPVVSIRPELNTTAVFATSDQSWHGHPQPTTRWRRSVAAYFFTEAEPPGYSQEHSTVWHPQGGVRGA